MNIFVLDADPSVAAMMLCNKHLLKMCVETAQLLCTAHPKDIAPYRHTHINHPCAKWTRASLANYEWLVEHGLEMCAEYTKRYDGKIHKTQEIIEWCRDTIPDIPDIGLTPFAVAISNPSYHDSDPVISYRAYYIGDKSRFVKWAPRAQPPAWWPFPED